MKSQFEIGKAQVLVPGLYPVNLGDREQDGSQAQPFNQAELLERVGNDLQLLAEISLMFQEDAYARVVQMESALAALDSTGLERAAHSLKGMLLNFGAASAVETALALENLGHSHRWDGSDRLLSTLALQVDQLNLCLDRFMKTVAS
jgi:HPt (histidine-containing phosphotransfer) domain-containing protein